LRTFFLILFGGIFFYICAENSKDSIYFGYSDFDAYKVMSTNINFSNSDSLSRFSLSGVNSKTFYEKYSKNDFGVKGDFSVVEENFQYGILLSTNHISNSSSSRPSLNDVRILPLIGYSRSGINARAALGYMSKNTETEQKTGQAMIADGDMIYGAEGMKLKVRSGLTGDNTDTDLNFNSDSSADLVKFFDGDFGNLTMNGTGNISQYHFPNGSEGHFRIRRYEYNVSSAFLYMVSEKISNTVRAGFYARNRDTYSGDVLSNYNSNTNISFSDEIAYYDNALSAALRFDFDTGGDKFSLSYDMNDKSLAFYNFSTGASAGYKLNDFRFVLNGKYLKHEYKSLTDSNLEDRDIIKISLSPELAYGKSRIFTVSQSFPLEYYHLVNISSQRSVNNFTDRSVNSVTDIKSEITGDLYVTGRLNFKSFFRTYDYDDNYSSSFVLKNYSFSDTVSYRLSKKVTAKVSGQYIYEEFGNFNYNNFTENPQTFKNSYYGSLSFQFRTDSGFSFRPEYYFHEIDSYKFDQKDFSKHDLTRVYIAHGPKIGAAYESRTFYIFTGFETDNFRSGEVPVRFRIDSRIKFE
jgi:hypothetical protein